jgi:hypothetical protein
MYRKATNGSSIYHHGRNAASNGASNDKICPLIIKNIKEQKVPSKCF